MSDLRQSPQYGKYMEKIGWQVIKLQIANCKLQIFIRKLPLLGSIIKIQRPETIPFEEVDKLAKKYRALFVKIEPCNTKSTENLRKHGFRPDKLSLLPTKTLQISLIQPIKQTFSQFKKDARYTLRKTKSAKGGQLIEVEDLEKFRQAWKRSVSWKRWVPSVNYFKALKAAFGQNAIFLAAIPADISYINISYKNILAGITLLIQDKVAYYYYAFSTKEGKELSLPYFLVGEAIKLAKKKGCRIFDFEGIYDERFPQSSWLGFTHFKKSFGGKEIEYPGPLIKIYNPILKLFFNFINLLSIE